MPASGTDDIYVCVRAHALLENKKEGDRGEKYVERQEEKSQEGEMNGCAMLEQYSDNITVKDSKYMKRGDRDVLGFSVFLPSI